MEGCRTAVGSLSGLGLAALLLQTLAAGCTPGQNGEREILSGDEGFPDREYAVATESLVFGSGGREVPVYVARPEEGEPHAIVVVVHEWWGLNDWMRSVADRLAARGYLATVPDLYGGRVATDAEHAHELMRGLSEERVVADLRAALAFSRDRGGLDELPAGIVGFCMGGRFALLASLDRGPFGATVVCYGRPVTDVSRLETLTSPLLGIYAAEDRGIDVGQVEEFEQALSRAGKVNEIIVYPDAGHAFLNDTRDSFAPAAAERAWEEIDDFLDVSLKAQAERDEAADG